MSTSVPISEPGAVTRRAGFGATARRVLAPTLAVATAASAIFAAPAVASQSTPGDTATNNVADFSNFDWKPCPPAALADADTKCAETEVPKDYTDPDAGTITVTFSWRPATGSRQGVIAGNPGGPGGSALGMFSDDVVKMPAQVREHFDLIAVQPRGLRWATPLNCDIADIPLSGVAAGNFGALYSLCETQMPGYAKTITTENTARDLNEVRQQLGVDQLSLYGVSYGSDLMSTYATLFPNNTDGIILDSGVDPDDRFFDLGPAREPWRRDALNAMFEWMAERNDTYGLGTTPLAVYKRWSERVNEEVGAPGQVYPPPAEVGDVPAAFEDNPEALLPVVNEVLPVLWRGQSLISALQGKQAQQSKIMQFTFGAMYSESVWPILADIVKTGELPAPQMPEGVTEEDMLAEINAMAMVETGIICNDNLSAADPSLTPKVLFNGVTNGDMLEINADGLKSGFKCTGWPAHRAAITPDGSALTKKPLILHYNHDSAVTGISYEAIEKYMGGDVHVYEGYGHGVLGAKNGADMVAGLVSDYYLN
ncbi:alpha/beta hydrolase [Corynebacterium sp. TAE3-ERU12]|uniref:alpha/beta hydrolase n=1 Tax=Corynebacterium sp. TAE3-ERU12 TaxID=2849491 RepID=UPI001C46F6D1|nr:alpha/beta hydrolase [Corynebacterium sp. TAE3-ERU12]MBV7294375.1 alpha/beta hydrolase [Corynebacterium sp. TAE3-ERU12]